MGANARAQRAVLGTAAILLGTACAAAPQTPAAPGSPPEALARATQLVVVTTPGWDSTAGRLSRFERPRVDAPWRPIGGPVPVVVGRSGVGWGVGFDTPPGTAAALQGPRKREGDGRSPAGAFPLDGIFGFPSAQDAGSRALPYLPLAPTTECVDDTLSAHYNRVVDRTAVAGVDWRSAERMREIPVYRLGILVGYNPVPVAGRGSCIFLHIWEGPRSTTAGCTALDRDELAELVAWLDREAAPVLVQMPDAAYAALRSDWRLPTPHAEAGAASPG